MRPAAALALILFASAAVSAENQRMHLVQPKGVELVLTKLVRANDLFAEFSGQVWVAGTVVGRWPAGATNKNYKEPDYLLVPDRDSVAKLPYFVLREPPYFNQYKVRSIALFNGANALRIAAGEVQTRRLLERRANQVRVMGRFLIEDYVVGVECDASWAKAVLVKAELPDKEARFNTLQEGC